MKSHIDSKSVDRVRRDHSNSNHSSGVEPAKHLYSPQATRVMQLQRLIGNRAVTQLMKSGKLDQPVQRSSTQPASKFYESASDTDTESVDEPIEEEEQEWEATGDTTRHPNPTTANLIDFMEFDTAVSDGFITNHICATNKDDARQQARNRLLGAGHLAISTVLIMDDGDREGLLEEVKFRNHLEYYGTGDREYYASIYAYDFVEASYEGTEIVLSEGTAKFLYNVDAGGNLYSITHFVGLTDVTRSSSGYPAFLSFLGINQDQDEDQDQD